jgi:alpha/beta hydrolase fold
MLEKLYRMNKEIDIRPVLPTVRVPTLVIHGGEDQVVPVQAAAYTAQRIRSARFIELPGVGHLSLGAGTDRIGTEIERFLTDVWETGGWEDAEPDRILATILFTDIVESTVRPGPSAALAQSSRACTISACRSELGSTPENAR